MVDRDSEALRLASAAVTEIDVAYRVADAIGKEALAEARDQAWSAYALARGRLLTDGVLATEGDLAQLRDLSKELDNAAQVADIARGAIHLAGFLGRLALT